MTSTMGLCLILSGLLGCRAPAGARPSQGLLNASGKHPRIVRVLCFFDQRPWLNLDTAGDRDPEGILYRVFLDDGSGRGVLADGTLHVEMYVFEQLPDGKRKRTLTSDWHYPTTDIQATAKPGMLGHGYVPRLAWKDKAIAGKEIELITSFESPDGSITRSATKRLRIPKYGT